FEKISDVTLKTRGVNIIFHFGKSLYRDEAKMYITLEPVLENLGFQTIKSDWDIISRKHLLDLFEYLLDHAEKLKTNKSAESPEIVNPCSPMYFVQGLGGDYNYEEESADFSLRFMVLVYAKFPIYTGCMTTVSSTEIRRVYNLIRKQ
ncbi:MAG: hypothetical protein AAF126_03145, partial [Chloroflexota bacterium]